MGYEIQQVLGNTDVNAADQFGRTALLLASKNGHDQAVEALLKAGAKTEAKLIDGSTPLLLATGNGHIDVVKALLDAGANIEARGNNAQTPLVASIAYLRLGVTKILLEKGASLEAKDGNGRNAREWATLMEEGDVQGKRIYIITTPVLPPPPTQRTSRAPSSWTQLKQLLDEAEAKAA